MRGVPQASPEVKNLDYEPGFWLVVLILLPFVIVAEVLDIVTDCARFLCTPQR